MTNEDIYLRLAGLSDLIAELMHEIKPGAGRCIHRNKHDVTTMGMAERKYICKACGVELFEPWPE